MSVIFEIIGKLKIFLVVLLLLAGNTATVIANDGIEDQPSSIGFKTVKSIELGTDEKKILIKENSIFYGEQVGSTVKMSVGNEQYIIEEGDYSVLEINNDTEITQNALSGTEDLYTADEETPLYEEESDQSNVLAILSKEAKVYILEENSDFIKVSVGQRDAYIIVEEEKPSEETSENLKEGQSEDTDTIESEVGLNDDSLASKEALPAEELEGKEQSDSKQTPPNTVNSMVTSETTEKLENNDQQSVKPEFKAEDEFFKVDTSSLSVYVKKGDGLTKAGVLEKDQVYKRESFSGNWHVIKIGEKSGYVWVDSTTPVQGFISDDKQSQNSNEKLTVIKSTNVFIKDGGNLVKYATLTPEQQFTVLKDIGDWLEIEFAGKVAYVYQDNVRVSVEESPFIKIKNNTPLYVKSGSSLREVGTLSANSTYHTLGLHGNWQKVKFGKIIGYVWNDNVEYIKSKPINSSNLKGDVENKISIINETNVYDNSNGSLTKIAELNPSVEYPLVNQYGNWFQVEIGGVVGYIHKDNAKQLFTDNIRYFKVLSGTPSVYDNRSGSLKEVGTLSSGQTYQLIGEYGDWHVVKLGEFNGYVYKGNTEPSSRNAISNVSGEPKLAGYAMISKNIPVYDNSSGKLVKFASLAKNTNYKIEEDAGNWLKINFAGRKGFIYKPNTVFKKTESYSPRDVVYPLQTYTYDKMKKDIEELRKSYPGLVQVSKIGTSVDGRDLMAVKLGKGSTDITINASHHAREWITTNLVMEMLDSYAYAYAKDQHFAGYNVREVLNHTSIWFVPMVNPDGVSLVQLGANSARNPQNVIKINNGSRDFSSWKANVRGVDLNRQYPVNWAIKRGTNKPSSQDYKGPSPLSEPESKAMYDFTMSKDFKTAVAYHTSGEILYWAYEMDDKQLIEDNKVIAKMITDKTGYTLLNPSPEAIGAYDDWFISQFGRPGFTPEVSPYVGTRPVPLQNFRNIWEQNKSIGLMLAQEAYQNRNNR